MPAKEKIDIDLFKLVFTAMARSDNLEIMTNHLAQLLVAALEIKGCAIFAINPETEELEVLASFGLSMNYVHKGPISALHSIADSLEDGPMAVYDVSDDPRIQYPAAAEKEGIASILSVPIMIGDEAIGTMRAYTAEKWEFTLDDVNFVQALAQIAGVLIEMSRLYKGQSEYIDVLETIRETPAL